jgi:hypothetical protein
MGMLRTPSEWTRLTALTLLGRSTPLFYAAARLGSGGETLVSSTTGLCVEAPPRSANSFFTKGFSMANPGVSIAHHHHVPAQVHRAMDLGVPVVTLLRNPIDCALAKAAPTDERFLLGTTLRRWMSFWHGVHDVFDSIVVAQFEDVTRDPASIVGRINSHWSSDFSEDFPPTESVFAAMEEQRIRDQGDLAKERPNPNVPNIDIRRHEDELRDEANSHALARPALKLYESLLERLG